MSLKDSTQKLFATDEATYNGPQVSTVVGKNIMVRTATEFKDVQEYSHYT